MFCFDLQVLVHGTAEATEHLKQHCLKHVCPHVYAPQIEETIDVTSDLCAYKVVYSQSVVSVDNYLKMLILIQVLCSFLW